MSNAITTVIQQNLFPEKWKKFNTLISQKITNLNFKDENAVIDINFTLAQLNAELSNFIRCFKNFERYHLYRELHKDNKLTNTLSQYQSQPSLTPSLKDEVMSLFGTSKELLEFNNFLLEVAEGVQKQFIEHKDEIEFSELTERNLANYLDKKPKLVSFFMSVGNGFPDEDLQKAFSEFKDLYDNELNFKKYKDELYNYASVVFGLNECIKVIAYISPNLIMKGI